MRILFLGAGAIGGYFGGRMVAAGADVTFLVRERRAAQLADGLRIKSPVGDATIPVRTMLAGTPADPFDVVVVASKAYGLGGALDAIAPHVGPNTGVLPFLNGLAHIEAIDQRFPDAVRLGGVAQIPANLTSDGVVSHNGKLQAMIVGARDDSARAAALRDGFVTAAVAGGISAKTTETIEQDLWDKWVFLTSLAAGTTLMDSAIGPIIRTDHGEAVMLGLLGECTAVATASGHRPGEDRMSFYRGQLTAREGNFMASMLHDMRAGNPTEADHIVGDMIRRARAQGVPTPLLDVALTRLQVYEAARG